MKIASLFIQVSFDWLLSELVGQKRKKNCPSCGSLKEGQLKCNGKQINLMMAYRTDRQLTWENENRVSLYLIMLSRLIVKTALASVISRLSDFRGVIIQWCLTHPNRKSSLFPHLNRTHSTNQMRTYWKFINLTATVYQNIRWHIRAKVTFKKPDIWVLHYANI